MSEFGFLNKNNLSLCFEALLSAKVNMNVRVLCSQVSTTVFPLSILLAQANASSL